MRSRAVVGTAERLLAVLIFILCPSAFAELTAHDQSVELVATVSETPAEITLHWLSDANAQNFRVSRKVLGESSWTLLATVDRAGTSWKDSAVTRGVAYEYQVIKPTSQGYTGFGYICAAIQRAAVETRGRMILLVEKDLGAALPGDLLRLQQDLAGDGWMVVRRDVAKNLPVAEVKSVVRAAYEADPAGTTALFIFGHVPVPYSGNISPDMHSDDIGAWPADVYYGEFDGAWTDTTVTRTNGFNKNVPGDGKFDQDQPPGPVRLQIGRVDLSNMTCFANKTPARYEVDLARQYLIKDHNFRHGRFDVQRRGLIFDRLYRGMEPEPQTCAAWRNFPAFFGRDQIRVIGEDEYFPILSDQSYLWSYVVSGGSTHGSDYIGTSDAWALNEPKVVFTSFLGSYFGYWDRESDFLRAPLGTSGYTLTCIFSGQPQWILHSMALGEPIGHSALLTQNNRARGVYPPQLNAGAGQVHIALMGDPGLRMHPVKPPGSLSGTVNGGGVTLTWAKSPDSAVVGYYVYKSSAEGGPYTRISGANALTGTSFADAAGNAEGHYMVRALKLEQTPSGSYYNLSQGLFYPDSLSTSQAPETPRNLSVSSITQGGVNIDWINTSANVRGFEIQRRTLPGGAFGRIAETPGTASSFSDSNLRAGQYAYRVKALGFAGDSEFSGEATINLQPSWGAIVGVDKTTGGDWIGKYGQDGHVMIYGGTNYPSYVTLGSSNAVGYLSAWNSTADTETLLRPDGKTRVAGQWLNSHHTPMYFNFRFSDSLIHEVSIYILDYKGGVRSGTLEVLDPFTGRVFNSVYFMNFEKGQYINLQLRNFADVRLVPEFEFRYNVMASGIFFSTPGLQTPTITPGSGTFPGKTTVSMTSTPGATIRFTTDGTDPGPNALTYGGPFVLTTTAVIKAKAVRDGYEDSGISTVSLTNSLQTAFLFVGVDATTQGDWKIKYGAKGQAMAGRPASLPSDVEVNTGANETWTWSTATTESRAVNTYSGARIASAWYSATECVFDVMIYSQQLREVALYFVDWDNAGRAQDITITDGSGATVLQRRIENFANGQYVVFNGKGSFRIALRRVAGPNAILNAMFFGNDVPVSLDPARLGQQFNLAGGVYTLRINGQTGQVFDIQSSLDLRTWSAIGRTTISGTSADFTVPSNSNPGLRFFRAVLVP